MIGRDQSYLEKVLFETQARLPRRDREVLLINIAKYIISAIISFLWAWSVRAVYVKAYSPLFRVIADESRRVHAWTLTGLPRTSDDRNQCDVNSGCESASCDDEVVCMGSERCGRVSCYNEVCHAR